MMLLSGVEYAHSKQKRAADILLVGLLYPARGMTHLALRHEFKKHGVDLSALILEQARVGQNGELFQMEKFRTLRPPRNRAAISPITEWIRTKGFDETQQLDLIRSGTMSFMGRRALLPHEFDAVMLQTLSHPKRAEYKELVLPTKTGMLSSWGILAHTKGYTGSDEAGQRIEMELQDVVDGSLYYDLRLGVRIALAAAANELRFGNTPEIES